MVRARVIGAVSLTSPSFARAIPVTTSSPNVTWRVPLDVCNQQTILTHTLGDAFLTLKTFQGSVLCQYVRHVHGASGTREACCRLRRGWGRSCSTLSPRLPRHGRRQMRQRRHDLHNRRLKQAVACAVSRAVSGAQHEQTFACAVPGAVAGAKYEPSVDHAKHEPCVGCAKHEAPRSSPKPSKAPTALPTVSAAAQAAQVAAVGGGVAGAVVGVLVLAAAVVVGPRLTKAWRAGTQARGERAERRRAQERDKWHVVAA